MGNSLETVCRLDLLALQEGRFATGLS